MANDKPVDTIRDGALKATIWRNETKEGAFYSTTLSRTYKDEHGNYHDSHSFASNEMLRVGELARRSHNRVIALKREAAREVQPGNEPDKNRQRDRDRSPGP